MMKHRNSRMSLLLLALLSQLGFANVAQAESASEWAWWNEADNAGPTGPNVPANYGSNYQANSDQTRVGTNAGELLTQASSGDWVGYALYGVSSNVEVSGFNKVATLSLNPQSDLTTQSLTTEGYVGSLDISSDVAAFNMSFNSAQNTDNRSRSSNSSTFAFGRALTAFYGNYQNQTQTGSESRFVSTEGNSQYYSYIALSHYTGNQEPFQFTSYAGNGYFGKLMPTADLAYLASRNYQTYALAGSTSAGGNLRMLINFSNGTWQGAWGNTFYHNGFAASGNISGRTLSSTQLTGSAGTVAAFNVQSGSVTGSLVGIANASIEDVGVVGKTVLNIGATAASTTVVNDVFLATGGNR